MKLVYYPFPKAPFLSPEDVIESLDFLPGDKVLDFGAGTGFWAIPIAKKVGRNGHVFVTEQSSENLAMIKNKAERVGLDNISYFIAPYDASQMPIQTKIDVMIVANIISEIEDDRMIFERAKKLAKEGTRLIIIDWKSESKIGPRKEKRINEEDIILKAARTSFEFKKLLSAGEQHTGMYFVFNKK
ncbi:MAG: methyltransferase domain-containing protein [Patescibacteria group bacterium]|nr:methyltransferase domain-containing protein [Patescibacteria group bacterium]